MKAEILKKLDKLSADYEANPDTPNKGNIQSAIKYLKWVLEQSDPNLLLPLKLKNLNSWITGAQSEIANETNLVAQLDAAITHFPTPLNMKRPKAESSRIISELREQAEIALAVIQSQKAAIDSELISKGIELQTLEKELAGIRSRIDIEAHRLDTLVSTEQSDFSKKKSELETRAVEIQNGLNANVEAMQNEMKVQNDSVLENLATDVNTLRTTSEADVEKIKKLLDFASDLSLTGGYVKMSTEEKKASFWWTASAFVMLSIAAVNAFVVKAPSAGDVSWQWLLYKISMVFAFVLPGLYAASKSTSHRTAHLSARMTGIRLATLDAFLQNFDVTERDKIRAGLTEEFFKEKPIVKRREPIIGIGTKALTEIVKSLTGK